MNKIYLIEPIFCSSDFRFRSEILKTDFQNYLTELNFQEKKTAGIKFRPLF